MIQDLDGLRQRLVAEGIEVVDGELLPAFERFYSSDPFGNRLEFLERTHS